MGFFFYCSVLTETHRLNVRASFFFFLIAARAARLDTNQSGWAKFGPIFLGH